MRHGHVGTKVRRNSSRRTSMKRSILVLAAVGLLALAASASAGSNTTILIRHQMHGCHAWSLGVGKPYKAAQSLKVTRGSSITVVNDDVMAHQLFQTSGPRVAITKVHSTMMDMSHELKGSGVMAHPGAAVKVVFTKAGVYTFRTRFGEDYMKMPDTIGKDNTLTLKVVVS
jgi:plastocyanin